MVTSPESTTQESMPFAAEVSKMLHLVIHSLYANKEIFLRELISNASDASDKLRYLAQQDAALAAFANDLSIQIRANRDERELRITDHGIGMNRDDLIAHLGTIAKSGTHDFLARLSGEKAKDVQLIGQFGVGFYACFMVADAVTVTSRKAGEHETWQWYSKGDGSFTVGVAEHPEHVGTHGTSICLHLKEDALEYADRFRLRHIVTTYSDHIAIPIQYIEQKEDGTTATDQLNQMTALWMRPVKEVTSEQHEQFYHHVAHAMDNPWMTLHNKNEGTIEYTNLLYIPSQKPFDLFHPDRRSRVKLYVRRVFITDEHAHLVPAYLRFIRGIVDSEDLPLNVSRETLQHNAMIDKIRRSLTKKVISELKKRAQDDPSSYASFWKEFGAVLKEGLCDGLERSDELIEICRFQTTHDHALTSLDDYIARMKPGQDTIYYLSGDDLDRMRHSPQLEGFLARGIEVLLLSDTVDDFWVNVLPDYKEHPLQSVTRVTADLDRLLEPKSDKEPKDHNPDADDAEPSKQDDASRHVPSTPQAFMPVIAFMKRVLDGRVRDVRVSSKLTDTPVCLAVAESGMDIRMERFLIEQRQLAAASVKILEINPKHRIIQSLIGLVPSSEAVSVAHEGEGDPEINTQKAGAGISNDLIKEAEDIVAMLFDQACIMEGEPIHDTSLFSRRMSRLIEKSLEPVC